MQLPPHHQNTLDRFVAAGQADARVVAAFLGGSYARGAADAYSDLDLYLITTDDAHESFIAGREAFVRSLGEPVFLEDFGHLNIVFYIFADGVEGELGIGRVSEFQHIHSGPFQILLDKEGLLTGAAFPGHAPAQAEQTETLRRQLYWFWHELSHFITALGRGQLWWAYGQLEALRGICVNLARLRHNFADAEVGDEPYFKIETVMPVDQIVELRAALCLMEREAMLQSARVSLRFYRETARELAQRHDLAYPAELERVMVERLERLRAGGEHDAV